jgi:hypothetical protein
VQRLYHREYGAQEPGTFYQAIAGTVSWDKYYPA